MRRTLKTVSPDGLFKQNIVLMSGLVTAPIIVAATSAERALVLVMSFFLISYTSILICRVFPRKIAYSIRIFLYAVVAGIMYIPTMLILQKLFPQTTGNVQLYIGLLVVNSLLLAKTEMRFYLKPYGEMALDSLIYVAGYAMVAFIVGFLREVLAYGTLFGYRLVNPIVPAAKSPFFGFILVGIMAALCRAIVNRHRSSGMSDEQYDT
ncbi:MAG: Rnf-Nqr domain containing protein [Oscillospiraceae bacterium]